MDTLNLTNHLRRDLITYVSQYLDAESLKWFRDTISNINKNLMDTEDFQFHVNVYNLYSNFEIFFKEYVTEVTAAGILYTLYSSAKQIGVRFDSDKFTHLEQVKEFFDLEDFALLNNEDIVDFDYGVNIKILRVSRGFSTDEDIKACGLITLTNLKFI